MPAIECLRIVINIMQSLTVAMNRWMYVCDGRRSIQLTNYYLSLQGDAITTSCVCVRDVQTEKWLHAVDVNRAMASQHGTLE
mmetsp:Transcript_21869/g.37380  ORF Transcript_21869/g.37380 Transcript_21869/m.37380 type:complete len:82 (-) Transcript_21869:180-425(-)